MIVAKFLFVALNIYGAQAILFPGFDIPLPFLGNDQGTCVDETLKTGIEALGSLKRLGFKFEALMSATPILVFAKTALHCLASNDLATNIIKFINTKAYWLMDANGEILDTILKPIRDFWKGTTENFSTKKYDDLKCEGELPDPPQGGGFLWG